MKKYQFVLMKKSFLDNLKIFFLFMAILVTLYLFLLDNKNLDKIIETCSSILDKDGILAFSTFSPDNLREFREVSGLSLEYKSVDYIKKILEKNFEIISIESFEYKLQFDNPLKILAHMKSTGVNSLDNKGWGIKEVRNFCDKYKLLHPDLTLTYAPIIVVCKKK